MPTGENVGRRLDSRDRVEFGTFWGAKRNECRLPLKLNATVTATSFPLNYDLAWYCYIPSAERQITANVPSDVISRKPERIADRRAFPWDDQAWNTKTLLTERIKGGERKSTEVRSWQQLAGIPRFSVRSIFYKIVNEISEFSFTYNIIDSFRNTRWIRLKLRTFTHTNQYRVYKIIIKLLLYKLTKLLEFFLHKVLIKKLYILCL